MTKVVKLPLKNGSHVWLNPRRFLTVIDAERDDHCIVQMNIPMLKFEITLPAKEVADLLEEAQ